MDRLTSKNKVIGAGLEYHYAITGDETKAIDKLAQLEDLMEKYGIESVEELDSWIKVLREQIQLFIKDRDTWKNACELACDYIFKEIGLSEVKDVHWDGDEQTLLEEMVQQFYTQAQKDLN